MKPLVSVIVTVRDERRDRLDRMLAAIAAQQSVTPLEVVIAVAPTERSLVAGLDPRGAVESIRIVDNPSGRRSPGLNLAARAASGTIVCRVDARSRIPPRFVARCTEVLSNDPRVAVAGGIQLPVPAADTALAKGIARALGNPYALGAPRYRRAGSSGPAETVYLGAFRREELLRNGGFDERLDANEDFELCTRLRRAGATVWLVGDVPVMYEARATLGEVFSQYWAFGRSKVRYWRTTGSRPNLRQGIAGGLTVVAGAGGLLLVGGRPRRMARAVAITASALVVLDRVGAGTPPSARDAAAACATYPVVYSAWLLGIARELLLPGRRDG